MKPIPLAKIVVCSAFTVGSGLQLSAQKIEPRPNIILIYLISNLPGQ